MPHRIFITVLIVVWAFIVFEDWISTPSCRIVAHSSSPTGQSRIKIDTNDNLKVMMVSNLLLSGSEAGFVDKYFMEYYMSKFFEKSFGSLLPDMLIVLGDVSERGYKMAKSGWYSVLRQFQAVIGPFNELPLHVVLGDRDAGACSQLTRENVDWVAGRFPGLDSAGSGAFRIGNIGFLSLNAVALLCGNNDLRFSTEKRIERERSDIQMELKDMGDMKNEFTPVNLAGDDTKWRGNDMSSGSGPVVLLHFPLHRTAESCAKNSNLVGTQNTVMGKLKSVVGSDLVGNGPYDLLHHLPANATEYIFQALKPRIIFSGHQNGFCTHIYPDSTLEVTVPALSWNARDDPGFILATFKNNGAIVSITQCFLAKESHILAAIASSFILCLLIGTYPKHILPANANSAATTMYNHM
uniref:Metallophosphoesterase 1 n=1 Tax=Kalanchoe fedtschenkoi TaxID=63787 RepID=A0A7N0UL15_KALFE